MRPVVLHAPADATDPATLAVLGVAAAASAVLTGLGLAAFLRRRSQPYLLVGLALSSLLARSAVGVADAMGRLAPATHHLLEHGLDVVMAGLVIAAVVTARRTRVGGRRDGARDGSRPGETRDGSGRSRSEPAENFDGSEHQDYGGSDR